MFIRLPKVLRLLKQDVTMLHPTLPKVLQKRAGAAEEFRAWTRELVERCQTVENLCAAHSATLLGRENQGESIAGRIEGAVRKVEAKVRAHERRYG